MDTCERNLLDDAVRQVVILIPRGRATSYVAIARAVGYPTMARLVGRIMAGLDDEGVHAHRVVDSKGRLSGRAAFGPGSEMADRLRSEGVEVCDNAILNWRKVFWDPLTAIEI